MNTDFQAGLANVHFFMGIDPAPAFGNKSDDGGLVAARVFPKVRGQISNNPADWWFQYVWAYRLRGASIQEWGGFIHRKHREFGFTRMMLDIQSGGGGPFIARQLRQNRQLLDQVETECTPIVTLDETLIFNGAHILHLFRRKDPGIAMLWPILQGDDNLVDAMHTIFRQTVEHTGIQLPPPWEEIPSSVTGQWAEEQQWAVKNLAAVGSQMTNIQVASNEDGSYALTSRGAKQYSAVGKKDLAYAAIYCYVGFLCWLVTADLEAEREGMGENKFAFF